MSAPTVASLRRHHGLGTVALLAAACLLASGCGERFGPGSERAQAPAEAPAAQSNAAPATSTPATSPPSTPPTTPVAATTPELGESENVGGVIWQPKALYAGPVQVSVRDGYVAAIVPSGSVGQLQVAAEGGVPVVAAGAGTVPSWGRPHVGTDVSGRTVVTYPRCGDPEAVGTCDIYQWTAETQREVVLRGVSGTALAETEAVMDFGTTLVVREKRPVLSADDLRYETPPLTTLLLKRRGKPLRVITRHGGRQVDLRGSRIADVYTVKAPNDDDCGVRAARALNLSGLTVASHEVACERPGMVPTGPSVADNHLRFGIADPGRPSQALDHDLATGRTRGARLTRPVEWWTPDGKQSGYALDTVAGDPRCSPAVDAAADLPARCRISRSARISWKPTQATWKVRAGDPPVKD